MNSFRLQSNPTSTFAYSQLNKTQALLNKNIQRLSSGLRINSAADDTAGSAMATRMTNQIRGMHQANRNSRDANNLLATTEAGLNNIGDLLAQMRELSVQAATDTLNDNDRSSIDLEFQALKDELTRISNATEYNGMNVLNGTYQSDDGRGHWRLQIGAEKDINKQHEVSIMNATAKGLDFDCTGPVSYTHLRAHENVLDLVCRLLLEKKKKKNTKKRRSENKEIKRRLKGCEVERRGTRNGGNREVGI